MSSRAMSDLTMAGKIDTVVAKSLESSDYLGNNEDLQKVTNENSVTLLTMKEIDKTNKERISKKTYESTMWSFNVFKNWAKYRNQHIMDLDEQYPFVPVVDLKNTSANEMNYWLTRFILETNKGDGTPYPANSLYMIACGLLRYFRDCLERRDLNILAKGNPDFQSFQNAMYSRMKETAASGIGTKKKPAEPLTIQEEDILWSSGIIGLSSSQSLSYGVFFYNCKRFGFRSMNEHVNLMAEQYEIGSDREGEFINYTGRQVCKYMQDGVQRRKLEVKVTKHYAQPGNPHCVVNLFKVYMQCIPTAGRFYRKPLPTKELADIRFGSQPVGINVLSKYLRSMCSAANIDMDGRRFTNGSVKMTCMTTCRYYGRGECGDQTIMSHTGHQSSLVHSSKRPSSTMVKSVSDEIQPTPQPEKKSKITTESIDEDSDSDASLIIQNGDTRLLFHFDTNEDSDMDSMENSDELPSEDTKMDTSDAMPSELLSVVDALCQRTTTSSYDDDDDDDGKSSDIHDDDRGSDSIDDIEGGDNYSACKHTFDTLRETFEFGVDNNEFSNRIEEQSKNGANRISAGFCSGSSGESASADSIDLQSYEKHETRGFGDGLFKVDIPTLRTSERSSTDTLVSGITREGQERSSLPTRTVDIPTYTIEDKTIVILPDIYRVIREVCGTCSPLRGQVSKLSIVPQRFYPRHMVRLKHVGAVGLEVKCCSYILLEEFLQVIAHYKDKAISPDMINLIPAVDISATPGESNESLDDRVTKTLASKVLTEPPNPLHTFIVEDELVVCTVELQQAFESLFGNVFSVSLTKLGICQNKFTSHQLDEVMDFVDIDESNISSAVFYVTKKDAERVFQYAEALFNVAQLKTKWLDPLKLSEQTSSVSDDDKHPLHKDVIVTMVKIPANSQPHVVTTSNTISGEMSQRIESTSNSVKPVEHSALEENRRRANDKGDWVCASSSESVPGKVLESKSERTVLQQGSVSEIESHDVDSIMVLSPETFPSLDDTTDTFDQSGHTSEKSSDGKVTEGRVLSSVDLLPSMEAQDSVSSPASEASICSDSDSCSSICTYLIDGSEVVCIPDIHKIVIHLYGQSVQVGYYLQRLQIPTQRFSTVHVKRLKALHALNSKATLCTYILKSDALRLLKMYDVFCTVSKLQQIQWNGPLCLEGIQSAIPPRDEVMTFAENLTTAQEPVEVVKISTFLIDGEVVVSVPDAHKVVQVLNGQSVQVRYNMDKLGIVKRRYSYSQVYQLRAISDLKRPSMCTFITKHDADILLGHYLTNENSSRMKYIQWLPPVRLEELPTCGEDSQDGGYTGVPSVDARNVVRLDGSDDQHFGQECVQRRDLCEQTNATETRVTEHGEATNSSITQDSREKNSSGKTSENESADAVRNPLEVQQDCGRRELESNLVTSASYSQVPCAVSMEAARGCTEAVDSPAERMQHDVGQNEVGRKRTYDEFKDKESVFLELKRLRDENHEIGATLERKETEMRILHDAYQQQVVCEREKRLAADKEAAELKASNVELRKNLQRKESEMKILHDSYLYQIRKEREKREELENDLIDLRGSVAFASGVAIRDPNIKQENV